MDENNKLDVFERLNRSQVKQGSYRAPRNIQPELPSIEDSESDELSIDESSQPMFKDDILSVFGINITDFKQFGDKDLSLFVILSGGEEKEKDYFRYILEYPNCFPKIRISFITGTDLVKSLYAEAVRKKGELGGYDVNIGDRICIITDVDCFKSDIIDVQPLCDSEDISLIISNPCFEVWLYYSYFDNMPTFTPVREESQSSEFKHFLNSVKSGGIGATKAIYEIETAIINSKKNYSETDSFPDFLTTQMHILSEKMLPLVKDGLLNLSGYQKQKRLEYEKARIKE